jgi:electron transport complex protein RnfC
MKLFRQLSSKTFRIGGVHPASNKWTAECAIVDLPLPPQVVIPLSQHIGLAATPLVDKGDRVKTGQLIGKASNFMSANIHSSVTGVVERVEDVMDTSGYKRLSVIIKVEPDVWMDDIDTTLVLQEMTELSDNQIVECIEQAGVVGLGGAAFPTHIKLSIPAGKTCDVLIINGAECEPYLTADYRLMLEKPHELIVGIQLLMKALNVKKAIIGIENNKPDVINLLSGILGDDSIVVFPLKTKYPQGGEKQLIDSCLGRRVPSGKLPIEVGVVVHNVGTALAVYEAVMKRKPLIDRIVTVTGSRLTKPGNFRVRIGTPVSALIEAAGGLPDDTAKMISGGPMMGKSLASPLVPVVKGTSGILLLSQPQTERKPVQNCIRCAKCVAVCPMGLSPYLLMSLVQKGMLERAEDELITDCVECGSCSYTCPSQRPLLDYIRLGKTKVNAIVRQRKS